MHRTTPYMHHRSAQSTCVYLHTFMSHANTKGTDERKPKHKLELKGKLIRQMTPFMVTPEEEEGIGVPYLERPQIQNTLFSLINFTVGTRSIPIFTSILKYPRST